MWNGDKYMDIFSSCIFVTEQSTHQLQYKDTERIDIVGLQISSR